MTTYRYVAFTHPVGLTGVWLAWQPGLTTERLAQIEVAVAEWRRQMLMELTRQHLEEEP